MDGLTRSIKRTVCLLAVICLLVAPPAPFIFPAYAASVSNSDIVTAPISSLPQPKLPTAPKKLVWYTYTVQTHDTLAGLAQQWWVSEDCILAVNQLTSRDIVPGTVLRIPSFEVRVVQIAGGTLYEAAAHYNLSVSDIVACNPDIAADGNITSNLLYLPVNGTYGLWEINKYRGETYIHLAGKNYWFAKFIHPLQGTWTRRFGWDDLGRHRGLDIAAPFGAVIVAPRAGRVVANMRFFDNDGLGNRIWIDHGNGLITLYSHLHEAFVTEGQWVEAGQAIGRVGDNGRSFGSHLHFGVFIVDRLPDDNPEEILHTGTAVDPELFLRN